MFSKHHSRPPAGQSLRSKPGTWERAANTQQKKLVRVYDQWSTQVRREILKLSEQGVSKEELAKVIDRRISGLETDLLRVMREGVLKAATVAVGREHISDPAVQSAQNKQSMENDELVTGALIPNIHLNLREKVLAGEDIKSQALLDTFNSQRSLTAQYAGGFWVMIFNVQQSAGIERERMRKEQGLAVEPVRWVLDPRAEHCHNSGGYYGCAELAGEYPDGWNSLPTVPAGQVTCRGNCKCTLEVFRNGKWQRGLF